MPKALKFCTSSTYRDILGYSLAFVFFYYLVIFACVAPSPELVGAVAFEISVYLCFLIYRLKRRRAKSVKARQVVFSTLLSCIPGADRLVTCGKAAVAALGTFVLLCVVIDGVSFGLAASGQVKAATLMYSRFPVSVLAGVNPGYTMELLSGAKVKAQQYAEVEQLYNALLEIRLRFFGVRSEQICNIYADFGDLCERRLRPTDAESFYVHAIDLSDEIKVPQGCGKYLTRLGQLEAAHGRIEESLCTLEKARAMRSRIFGPDSRKVADTLIAMVAVYKQKGDFQTADKLSRQAVAICRAERRAGMDLAFYSALVSLSLMGGYYLLTSKNGLLTKFALVRLTDMLSSENISAERKSQLRDHLQVLKEFTGANKSRLRNFDNNHEGTHFGLLVSLALQG